MQDLGTLGGLYSNASAVNSHGQIVGGADTDPNDSSTQHAFLYDGAIHDLGTLGGDSSTANGINDSGQVVGSSTTVPQDSSVIHAFSYSNGSMQDLGTLGGSYSNADAINSHGQIVGGFTLFGDHAQDLFLYSNGIMHDLGNLPGASGTEGRAINDLGQIVGDAFVFQFGSFRAVLYADGTMHDLNNLLDASGNGVTITHATAINNQGWIVGHGSGPDGEASFLLTPVPEPSGLTLAGFAMMAFAMIAPYTNGMPRRERRLASVVVVRLYAIAARRMAASE